MSQEIKEDVAFWEKAHEKNVSEEKKWNSYETKWL